MQDKTITGSDPQELNEKFFDLKKEKQDRMINASMRAFATAGFAHASTDDIVRDAGVSKGLLFHYFESKLGLYEFLYDYAVKFEQLELSSCVGRDETDFFALREQMLKAHVNCMKNYPYLPMFLDSADREEDPSAGKAVGDKIIAHTAYIREILARADGSGFRPEADMELVGRMLVGAFRGVLPDALRLDDAPGEYYRACGAYLGMMRELCRSVTGGASTDNNSDEDTAVAGEGSEA